MPNYKSFDDVLNDLEMDEDELKRLVSEGQIRAFRDDDRMKFRSEDVQSLARARSGAGGGGDDLDLGETQLSGESLEIIEEETDETLLDLGSLTSDQDFEDTGATSVPTVELDGIEEDADATLTEELVFDETDELGSLDFGEEDADATQKIEGGLDLSDDDLGLETEPVEGLDELDDLDDGGMGDVNELDDLGGGDYIDDEPVMAGPPPAMPGPVQIQEQVKYVEIVPNEGILWKVLTGLTFILALLLMITPTAVGVATDSDSVPLAEFGASTAYGLYLKGPNENPPMGTLQYEPQDPTAVEPFSVGTKPDQVVWPGMNIIRDFNGYYIDSASAKGSSSGESGE